MSDTFTVFYDNTSKEIAYALRGTAASEQISAEASAGRGYVTTTRSDDVATKVYGGGVLLGTMNSDSSLTLTAKEAGVWRILFEKSNYYQGEVSLYVKRRGE